MEPRYYDATGCVNYEAIETYSGELRHQAIDAFWSQVFAKVALAFTKFRRSAMELLHLQPLA
jgi:hypothetical protein